MRVFYCILAVAVSLLAINLSGQVSAADEGRLSTIVVAPSPRLGLAFPGNDPSHYDLIGDGGLGVVRIGVSWGWLERRPGRMHWRSLDQQIVRLQQLGIEVFLTLQSDAPWGTRPETHGIVNGTPIDLETWAAFAAAVAERYDDDGGADAPGLLGPVLYYQVANEWVGEDNPDGGWLGTTEELVDFINASHDAIEDAAPDATFVLGGIAAGKLDMLAALERQNRCQTTFTIADCRVDDFVASASIYAQNRATAAEEVLARTRYDALDAHLYGDVALDPARIAYLRRAGGGRPVVAAECGGPSLEAGEAFDPETHFYAVLERNLASLAEGLPFCLWYRLHEDAGTRSSRRIPLLYEDSRPKPGYWAYVLLAAALPGVERVERLGPSEYWLHRPADSPLLIAWRGPGTAPLPLHLPADWPRLEVVRLTDVVRGDFRIDQVTPPTVVELSQEPVLVGVSLPEAFDDAR